MPNGKWIFMITSLYSVRLKNLWIDRIALKTITSNSRKLSWRERKVITTSLACVAAYGVPFPPKFNVPFYIVLCTICPTFCVCHLSLHSRFNFLHSTFNFNLCNIQVFAFHIQLFNKQQSSFRIRPSSSVECTFIFSHPTFCICPLSFCFRHPTGYCTCKFPHSTFNFSNGTFTRWSATDGDRWLNWLDPSPLKWWSRVGRETSQCSGPGRPSPLPTNQMWKDVFTSVW